MNPLARRLTLALSWLALAAGAVLLLAAAAWVRFARPAG